MNDKFLSSNKISSFIKACQDNKDAILKLVEDVNEIEFLSKGNKIHIKKKNRGKFTKSARRAGMSVLQYASHVLSDPNATALQKKRANFARNAKSWSK